MDTSRQGRGRGGRGGGERKRRWGNRKATMLRLPLLPGPCVSGATGGVQEGDKRQLKPVEVGHAPPRPPCWMRQDRAPRASWGAPASRPRGPGIGQPLVSPCPACPGVPWEGRPPVRQQQSPSSAALALLSPGSASSLPAFPGSLRPGCLRVPEPFPSHPA